MQSNMHHSVLLVVLLVRLPDSTVRHVFVTQPMSTPHVCAITHPFLGPLGTALAPSQQSPSWQYWQMTPQPLAEGLHHLALHSLLELQQAQQVIQALCMQGARTTTGNIGPEVLMCS